MGDRALIAYDRGQTYDLHRSQYGGTRLSLRWRLTDTTPFGGGSPPPVDPTPTDTAVEPAAIGERIDPGIDEACYVVGQDFAVDSFLVASLAVPGRLSISDTQSGLLARPTETDHDGTRLRAQIEGIRTAVGAVMTAVTTEADRAASAIRSTTEPTECSAVDTVQFRRAMRASIEEWAKSTYRLDSIDDETF